MKKDYLKKQSRDAWIFMKHGEKNDAMLPGQRKPAVRWSPTTRPIREIVIDYFAEAEETTAKQGQTKKGFGPGYGLNMAFRAPMRLDEYIYRYNLIESKLPKTEVLLTLVFLELKQK